MFLFAVKLFFCSADVEGYTAHGAVCFKAIHDFWISEVSSGIYTTYISK